jgi:hypothetical protein
MSSLALAGLLAGFAISRASSAISKSDTKAKTQELKVTIKEWPVPTKDAN